MNVDKLIEITATLIIVYLVVINGEKFSQVVGAVGGVYNNSIRTLQGR